MNNLALIWGGIIAFCVVMYLVLDGFTLGIGMLLSTLNEKERSLALSVVLPTWDGNQTWLVLGMASLYGAFPLAFSTLLPILYVPLILMVITLLFRGVCLEFRLKAKTGKKRWDLCLILASAATAFIQGILVGNMAHGITANMHLINAFSVATGCGVVVAYLLLGATRLILKTDGSIQDKCYRIAKPTSLLFIGAVIGVSAWTPFIHPHIYSLWFSPSNWSSLATLPIITALLALSLWFSVRLKLHNWPYWLSVLLVLAPYIGFIVNLYPYAVPYSITYEQAAAPASTLKFLLVGGCVMLPVLLIYTGYAYRIFRGKVKDEIHY